jgi:hypothetical protein
VELEAFMLSQISVISITYARPIEFDLKHQCGDGRSHFSTDFRKNQSPVPSRLGPRKEREHAKIHER